MSTFLAIYSMICYWLSLVSLDIIIVSPEVKRGCLKLIEFMSITNTTVLSIPSGVFISSSVSGYHLTSDRWLDAHTVTLYCSTLGKKKKTGMWKTPVTKNQVFVHIRSIGRYDSRGTTCHWEIDKKRATGALYLPASRAIHRR